MNWKIVKIGFLIILGLLLIIPSLLYLNAIDLSKKHTAKVNALPLLTDKDHTGAFRLKANNLEFLVRIAGMQNDGEAVILLHGFPESSIMWQPLLDSAAARGYRVLAFDQRGYSPNARPTQVEDYEIDNLVADVLAIADEVDFDTFHLVGHDWGAGVGWKTVIDYPERIRTWTALSIPHIGVFFDAVLNHPEQQKRSAYMHRLRMPIIPEFLSQVFKDRIFEGVKGVWTAQQIEEYGALHSEHGATTATLNWYRAAKFEQSEVDILLQKKVYRPTLFIWGARDAVVAPTIIPMQESYIEAPYQSLKLDSGHSLIQLKQDSVLGAIFLHFDEYSS